MIEDEELRHIFKATSEERLQKLNEGLLHLEKHTDDVAKLEELLREAHSLKGDANMLGVKDIGTLSHKIEDVLGAVKRGELALSSEVSDRIYHTLDAISKLVVEATTGEPSGVNPFYVLAELIKAFGAEPNTEQPVTPPNLPSENGFVEIAALPTSSSDHLPLPPTPQTNGFNPELALVVNGKTKVVDVSEIHPDHGSSTTVNPANFASPQDISNYRIETIRVETSKLDTLMTQAGEMTVAKIRIAQRVQEIEEVMRLWEEWNRDAFVHRFIFDEVQRGDRNKAFKQLENFQHRNESRLERLGGLLNRLRSAAYEDTARLDVVASELEEDIRNLRLLPLSTIFSLFPRMVRDLAKQENKEINLIIEGGETRADKLILEEMKDPLMHMIRNAIDHGIETPEERVRAGKPEAATIRLRSYQTATNIILEVTDDGRGLDTQKIKQKALERGIYRSEELEAMTENQIQSLIFTSGFSTRNFVTEVSGRGVGLDVVRTNVERLKGSIQIESEPGTGCTLRIILGITLATAHVLIVKLGSTSYAVPVEFVHTNRLIPQHEIFTIEGRQAISLNNQPISVAWLADILEIPRTELREPLALQPCLILQVGEHYFGLLVDALVDEQDVVLKPQSKLLKRIRNISGATILGTGEVCMVLHPQDLLKSLQKSSVGATVERSQPQSQRKQTILLVEDSIAIRTQEKRILEGAGYEVITAVDGLDGFNKLKNRTFDAVVSDIQMPNLDGLSLTAKIRQHKEYSELPIILVTSLATEEDKRRGAEAGASAYIPKSTFNQKVLLDTLRMLV